MGSMIKARLRKIAEEQRGYVYILVLIFLAIGALMIPPLLNFMGTGLESGRRVFEPKTDELYACDAGIDDAVWQIKYENVTSLSNPVAYDEYDYTTVWPYELTEAINHETVSITIKNEWIPKIGGVNPSDPYYFPDRARNIITARKLRINGSLSGASGYRIRIDYAPEEGWVDLGVQSIGIWLPAGFSYESGSSNLENLDPILDPCYSVPDVEPYAGGEAVIWSFGSSALFKDLPPAGSTESAIISFNYASEAERRLVTISWIDTSGVDEVPFSWDADTEVYTVTSSAGNTIIESNVYMSGRYSSLLDNVITSPGDVYLQPGTIVNGDVQYNGMIDNKGTINGEEITDEIDWPDTEEWRQFFLDDVTGAPDPGALVDVKDHDDDNPLGPWHRQGNLDIKHTDNNPDRIVPLGGTIYVTGDLVFQEPGVPKAYTIDLDWNTIFVEGSITFPPDRVGIKGSGCIIAIGDINFQPQMVSEPGDFVFVCSLEGGVTFNPQGDFYGSIAGNTNCNLQPDSNIIWTSPPGQLNLPGMDEYGTGGFGSSVTKYTWKIR